MVFGSTMLEVAIGIIFVYLLISLLCSALNELINSVFRLRAWDLERGIMRLLGDPRSKSFFQHLFNRGAGQGAATTSPPSSPPAVSSTPADGDKPAGIADVFFTHPLIKPLYEDRKPSYIPARTFSLALWQIATEAAERAGMLPAGGVASPPGVVTSPPAGDQRIAGVTKNLQTLRDVIEDGLPGVPHDLKVSLVTLIDEADNKFDEARSNIEKWYDDAMDRVSGAFKRRTHYVLIALGFGVALAMNVDTFNIFRALYTNEDLRKTVVSAAENYANSPLPGTTPTPAAQGVEGAAPAATPDPAAQYEAAKKRIREIRGEIDQLGLPIGWDCDWRYVNEKGELLHDPQDVAAAKAAVEKGRKDGAAAEEKRKAEELGPHYKCGSLAKNPRGIPTNAGGWLLKLAGIFLTALAVSQGAPFWFDVLNKFIVIRSTVKPQEKSQKQKSKDNTADGDGDDAVTSPNKG